MSQVDEILSAVKAKDVAKVQALLDQNASLVNVRAESGETPILIAVYHGAAEVVELLLARGAELNIFEAAAVGDVRQVREWLDAQPDLVNAYSLDGWTPLHLAAFFGHAEVAELLLARGADTLAWSRNGLNNMPLHAAIAGRCRMSLVRALLAGGGDVNAKQQGGWTPLHQAAHRGDGELVALLLGKGADVNARKDDGETPLGLASRVGKHEVADLLRRHGGVE